MTPILVLIFSSTSCCAPEPLDHGHPLLQRSSELTERCQVFQFADGDFYMPDAWSFSHRCYELVTCFMNDGMFVVFYQVKIFTLKMQYQVSLLTLVLLVVWFMVIEGSPD